jgi:Zn-dependent peptidase ImmA (M78 family)/DNA-binding XRE family transcriptional regulator
MDRARITTDALAKKLGVKGDRALLWEEGAALPTVNQAKKLSTVLRIPYGFFYLPEPPKEEFPLPDLRTVGSVDNGPPSIDLLEVVRDAIQRKNWYEEYVREHGAQELQFVGKYTIKDDIADVVQDIRQTLAVGLPNLGSWDQYHSILIKAIEDIGVLVMRTGIVAGNTHRKLNVSEFRGFAISSKFAPLIFINSADAPAARLFTLIHELAHIWINSSGVSNISNQYVHPEETFCNKVAGEFLVPSPVFRNLWDVRESNNANFVKLAANFHVSKLVIAKKALDQDYISGDEYTTFYQSELESFRGSNASGGNYYLSTGAKNSKRFSEAVVREALRGSLLLRDAGRLLGIAPNKIKRYAKEIGI